MNLLKIFSIASIIVTLSISMNAQNRDAHCTTDEMYRIRKLNNPELIKREYQANHIAESFGKKSFKKDDTTTKIIPVVFHVLHTYGVDNISKQDILDQMDRLNKDFRAFNSDTSKIKAIFKDRKADLHYEFRLATIDPQGRCTDGIERISTPRTFNAGDDEKYISTWDNSKYLNIWVVGLQDRSKTRVGTLLGYAQFPWEASKEKKTDGIMMVYYELNGSSRTLTHEVGHWMGLFHPFQDGCLPQGGDYVDDTPPVREANYGCPKIANSCKNDVPDLEDMTENYMDYTDASCKFMFTKDQKSRIDSMMSEYRSNIYSSTNLIATGVNKIPNCAPIADFTSVSLNACTDNTVSFLDKSYNGTIKDYLWEFEGGNPATSTSANPIVSFAKEGEHSVKLTVSNAKGTNSVEKLSAINIQNFIGQIKATYKIDFEGGASEFVSVSKDYLSERGWVVNNKVGSQSKNSFYIHNFLNIYDNYKYTFELPGVDFGDVNLAFASFDLAFTRQLDANNDQLKVFASKDCGYSWNQIYSKKGSQLSTTYFQGGDWYPTSERQWRKEGLNLASYKGQRNVKLKFEFTTGNGNNIYIDNIAIGERAIGIEEQKNEITNISISPNPSNGEIYIASNFQNVKNLDIRILSIEGKLIYQSLNQTFPSGQNQFDLGKQIGNQLQNGMYLLQLTSNEAGSVKRMIINK